MVHPKPTTPAREALYGYLTGRNVRAAALPPSVAAFEGFKAGELTTVPDVPFQMLASAPLTARTGPTSRCAVRGRRLRMNLNTFARHGVFELEGMTAAIAARLRDREAIARAKAFPYQLLAAARSADATVPDAVRTAIEEAMELAIANVPAVEGQVYVCPDVSGSMLSPVTGHRKGATTAVRCIDVAGLMTAAIVRRNPGAEVLPFSWSVVPVTISPADGVLANAETLAGLGGGGTRVSAPLARLNEREATGDLVVIVSDNESWADADEARGTATMREWNRFRSRNPRARLALLDLQPYATTQAAERTDVLNVGGFSDRVFEVISEFAAGRLGDGHWVEAIESVAV